MTDAVGSATLRSQWDETVQFYGDRNFLEYVSVEDVVTTFTYREFDRKVKRAANYFLELGVQKGELVALHLHNSPEYLICWLALAQIGAVSVPMNEHYPLPESSYVIQKVAARVLVVEPRNLEMYLDTWQSLGIQHLVLAFGETDAPGVLSLAEGMARQPDTLKELRPLTNDEMAVILFTSGTTRHPKGAIYTHANVVYGGLIHVAQVCMQEGDRFLSSMPCYHMDFQEMAVMPCICSGSTLIMVEHYSARRFWSQVVRYEANFTDTMSMMNRTMMLQPVQPWEKDHCLKQIYFSMGMSTEEKENFESRFNVKLLNCYGMTETVSGVTCAPLFGNKNWPSVGKAMLSYELKIIGEDGEELPPGEIGEICVHGVPGRSLIPGYYKDPEATAALLDSEGWLHSGDRGYLDADGWLFFIDRGVNMIKCSGENVSGGEVESALTAHPLIADAAVIGVPDPLRQNAVKAFVLLKDGAEMTEEEVIEHCAARLAKFKVPSYVEFVTDFPRTSTGKVKKQLLH